MPADDALLAFKTIETPRLRYVIGIRPLPPIPLIRYLPYRHAGDYHSGDLIARDCGSNFEKRTVRAIKARTGTSISAHLAYHSRQHEMWY